MLAAAVRAFKKCGEPRGTDLQGNQCDVWSSARISDLGFCIIMSGHHMNAFCFPCLEDLVSHRAQLTETKSSKHEAFTEQASAQLSPVHLELNRLSK